MISFKNLNKKILFFAFLSAFLIVSVVPLLISGYHLLTRTEDELKSALNENNYLLARRISNELDAFQIERWISTLNGLSSSLVWNDTSAQGRRRILVNSVFDQVQELVILSMRPDSRQGTKHYVNQSFLSEMKGWNADRLASLFSFNGDSALHGRNALIRRPVFFDKGRTGFLPIEIRSNRPTESTGTLRGVFQLAPIFGFIDAEMSVPQRQIYILDDTGRILFQNKNGLFELGKPLPYPIKLPNAQSSYVFQTLRFDHLGKKHVGYLLPIQRSGWFVVIAYLFDKVYAPVSQMRQQMVMSIGFALILSVLLSFLFAWFHSSVIHNAKEVLECYAEKLEQSNSELEAFAHTISHELSAPLRHIMSYSDVLEMRLSSKLDPKSLHQLQNISGAAKNLSDLVYNVLLFSRVGYADINKTTIDLKQMVQVIQAKLETETASRKITWKIDRSAPLWGDPVMLQQVMFNLISNALKFTRLRKRAVIRIGTRPGTEEVVVYVNDNGVGFDMKDKNKLFGLFQRLHDKETFEGTGVGLAHVRRIIAKHGGRTWAEGEPGKGATFYFSLPTPVTPKDSSRQKKRGRDSTTVPGSPQG